MVRSLEDQATLRANQERMGASAELTDVTDEHCSFTSIYREFPGLHNSRLSSGVGGSGRNDWQAVLRGVVGKMVLLWVSSLYEVMVIHVLLFRKESPAE